MKISFEVGGRKVNPDNLADALMAAVLQGIEENLRTRIGAIRDPETGEFPVVVVRGRDLENLSVEVEGSERLVALVRERLGGEDAEGDEANNPENDTPVAFLCHGSEDKVTVRRLAEDLMAAGIDVFFDEWEIRSGDSLRRKIDDGLGNCSHFVAVLSPISVTKPWVNAEMDAAFVRKMNSEVKFIALRLGLPVGDLPPLLQGSHSPALDNYETDLASLVSDIHGISRKPPLGPKPSSLGGRTDGIGLSPAAEMVVRLMVEQSEHGDALDPQVGAEELQEATGLIDDDIEDAVDELSGQGFIQKHVLLGGGGTLGFTFVTPEGELFAKFDSQYKPWDPAKDAVTLASHLLAAGDNGISVPEAAGEFGWEPRRINPAIHYLVYRRLVDHGNEMGAHPWTTWWLRKNSATRRFVRDRG